MSYWIIIPILILASIGLVAMGCIAFMIDAFAYDEDPEEEKVPLVQRVFHAIKQYAKGLQDGLRGIIGKTPSAVKARQRAQRKKAGV